MRLPDCTSSSRFVGSIKAATAEADPPSSGGISAKDIDKGVWCKGNGVASFTVDGINVGNVGASDMGESPLLSLDKST